MCRPILFTCTLQSSVPCRWLLIVISAAGLAVDLVQDARGDSIDEQLAAIERTGAQGAGSPAAQSARDDLVKCDGDVIPRLLVAMQTDNAVAANWYRSIYETITERELAKGGSALPAEEIRQFVRDQGKAGRVRRLAMRLCDSLDVDFSKDWIPRQLDDTEFRDDAVDASLLAGQRALESGDSEGARDQFLKAFEHARASAQCVRAADKLAALGEQVDTQAHLGLVVDWWVIGPFDAPEFSGFDRSFPPEQAVDLSAHYTGQEGRDISWVRHRTADPLGLVDLVKALGPAEEAVGYAYTELESPRDSAVELRCGADDNCTVWLDGQRVFGRQQWLNGIRLDRFVTPVQLKRGINRLLVKVCQGPPNRDPQVANNWSLQLRFSDSDGAGIALRSALPPILENPK
jgi:hypothetical protein